MLKIGLTGGIASGKSAVAEMLQELGAGIIDTDVIAREVVAPGTAGLRKIRAEFGTMVLHADGSLNRHRLRERVFANPQQRRTLEQILHPLIRSRALERAAELEISAAPTDYLVFVVPLLVETDFQQLVDRVLVVDCDPDIQRARLMQRDQCTANEAEQILAAQADRSTRLNAADDIIRNNGGLAELRTAVRELHARYQRLAADLGPAKP